jgi:hypothetical protein
MNIWSVMHHFRLALPALFLASGLGGCQFPASSGPKLTPFIAPQPVIIDPAVGDPCTEAAMAKYFIGPERVTLLGASPQGGSTAVRMKADVRDALCLVSDKGNVISLTDTTPKSANQIAAEEAAAAAKEAGAAEPAPVVEPVKKKAKKKVVKAAAKPAKAASAAPAKKS